MELFKQGKIMQKVLRVIDREKMTDYDLQKRTTPIQVGAFVAFRQNERWSFQSEDVINANGNTAHSGNIELYDAYYLDAKTDKKVLILPIREGVDQILSDASAYTVGRVGRKIDKTTGNFKFGNSLELSDRSVSGKHCILYKPNRKHIYVTDLDSTNGTFVNDMRLAPYIPYRMKAEDILTVGPYRIGLVTKNKEVFPILLNMDRDVHLYPEFSDAAIREAERLNAAIPERNLKFVKQVRNRNPVISIGPRQLPSKPEYEVEIEAAPSINVQKPGLGSFGIGVNLPAMAIGFGMQAVNYALSRKKYTEAEKERADFYARYTSKIENDLTVFQNEERAYAEVFFPSQEDCLSRLKYPYSGLWARHYGDEDFLSVRLGTGTKESSAEITIPSSRLSMQEEIFEHVPKQIKDKYSLVQNMPIGAGLIKNGVLGVIGSKQETDSLIRSLVLQIAAMQNYDDVKLVLLCDKSDFNEWGWMRWFPHNYNDTREHRYIITEPEDIEECFADEANLIKDRLESDKGWSYSSSGALPVYVFIVLKQELLFDNIIGKALMLNREDLNITGVVAGRTLGQIPHSVTSIAEIKKNGNLPFIRWRSREEEFEDIQAVRPVGVSECDKLARSIAPVRMTGTSAKKKYVLPENIGFFEGMGLKSINDIQPEKVWGKQNPEDSMAVPIGVDENGNQVIFNIHENGQGPHGLVAGCTGSGKSKLVQSWIGSMAYSFSPEDVNFILVDFKGESLLVPFKKLPHVACFTSNLDPDVRRKFLAISSELKRRQDVIRLYNCDDLIEYRKRRRIHKDMPNIPFLFLVVDEFASFKTEYPEFTEPLDELFQKGRSLGFFAILMTQNPSGKVTGQMTANLGFRWCLRVDSVGDSREVLNTPDAAQIHNPGRVYFQSNKDGTYKLLQAFFGAQTYDEARLQRAVDDAVYALKPDGARQSFKQDNGGSSTELPDELEVLSKQLDEYCKREDISHAMPIWQPELPEELDLQKLMHDRANEIQSNRPVAALGIFDDPAHQKQSLLMHDLWNGGTLAVYGAPQSGKTTFLETYMLSLAVRYQPTETQFYILEYGGFRLEAYKELPHTGGYSNDNDPDCAKRIIKFLIDELSERKQLFHKLHVSSCEGYYELENKPIPVISLLIDNANSFLQNYGDFTPDITKLIKEGATYGINVIMSIVGTSGVYTIAPFIRKSYALRLNDVSEYSNIIATVRTDVSGFPVGRGFLNVDNAALQFQTAIIYAELGDAKRYSETTKWISEKAKTYKGQLPKRILRVPDEIFYGELTGDPFVIGIDKETIESISMPLTGERSLLISYGMYNANSSFIRCLIRQAEASGGLVYMYSGNAGEYTDLVVDERITDSINDLDKIMNPVHAALKERQDALNQNGNMTFPVIMVIIDGMLNVIKNAPLEINRWLEAFITLSEGLGYIFVGCDTMDNMAEVNYSADSILAITARKGPCMIIGGKISDHRLVTASTVGSIHPNELAWDEAVVSVNEGLHLLKLMRGD